MLSHLHISDYTIVATLDVEFRAGLTVLTGETGAGKSILLDALGLCLGDRADPKAVRTGCERAEISASFDVRDNVEAKAWLREHALDADDDCVLRRVITAEGRSRAWINGSVATLQALNELGEMLVDIHSQHAHQSLLRRDVQRQLIDAHHDQGALARQVEQLAASWQRQRRELDTLREDSAAHAARLQLLRYQLEELDALAITAEELTALNADQTLLANAEQILRDAQQALDRCEQYEDGVRETRGLLAHNRHLGRLGENIIELMDSAAIALSEAQRELGRLQDSVEQDPERLQQIEQRLSAVHSMARKHRVLPEQLPELHAQLRDELAALGAADGRVDELEAALQVSASDWQRAAATLTTQRQKTAKALSKRVGEQLALLAMGHCRFEVSLLPREARSPHPAGAEDIELRIATQPGATPQPLGRIASGGELSRISLAIQVALAETATAPAMVFDEVDSGIGGATAEIVGRLLRRLSQRAQILCVTHLPQVAAQGHQHLRVSKHISKDAVRTQLETLAADERIEEVARMLGGVKVTQQTRAHAQEMLETAAQ